MGGVREGGRGGERESLREGEREGWRQGRKILATLHFYTLSLPAFWLEERVWGAETSLLLRRHCIRVVKCKGQILTIEITCTACNYHQLAAVNTPRGWWRCNNVHSKMCGIWALFGLTDEDLLRYGLADCLKIAHRGPDMTRIETVKDVPHSLLGFHRLEVNDSTNGMQPMRLRKQYPHIWLVFNGEIYNAFTLRDFYEFPFESQCDAEVIIHLYARFGAEKTAVMLDGVFAFAILDTKLRQLYLGRDVFGVRPLFTWKVCILR